MDKVCCSLVCTPEVEEKLLDALLVRFPADVFTSTRTFGHGTAPGALTAAEQVMGRSEALLVQIVLSAVEMETLRALLNREFAGSGIRYWVTVVAEEGELA
ncbi:MAG: DUF3240 family protein [Dokdonella sp.]